MIEFFVDFRKGLDLYVLFGLNKMLYGNIGIRRKGDLK